MLTKDLAESAIARALARGGDFAEIFYERYESASASIDDAKISGIADTSWIGVGIRVVVGESTGFAHTSDLTEDGILRAADVAAKIALAGKGVAPGSLAELQTGTFVEPTTPELKRKSVDLLYEIDQRARSKNSQIVQVTGSVGTATREIIVANSLGVFAHDIRSRSKAVAQVVAKGDTGAQTGYEVFAKSVDFPSFLAQLDLEMLVDSAATRAVSKLSARPAPSGSLPVVIEKGSGGILFHEACGHGLEADHIVKGASVYTGKLGKQVASELVTLVDDGTVSDEWGTYAIDDEGNPARRNVLIENGVLVDYMVDMKSAKRFGPTPRGNGRREDYRSLPMVRMTNTFLSPGSTDPADIIADTEYGVYVARLSGGQVNTTTGDFVFGTQEAYLIENGKLTAPIRDTQLIGNGPEVLSQIDAVGNDFGMTPGTCGKDGQSVPVGTGQPTLRIRSITLGGTASA